MIYASTSCLKNPGNVLKVLNEYERIGIQKVELGSVHTFFDVKRLKQFNFDYVIHNYFPPPKVPFNFNLASEDKTIRKRSILLAKTAIELCNQINGSLYSFHAGFTVDPKQLGIKFDYDEIPHRNKAILNFLNSVYEIIDFASSYNIKLAIEPNVVQKFNLIKNKNELLLFAESDEIELLFKFFDRSKLGILLDLGHTSVTSHWLKFDKNHFVKRLQDKVMAIHISNNNGLKDQHLGLTRDCWQVHTLKKFKNIPVILESMNLEPYQIIENLKIIQNACNLKTKH